MLIEKLATDQSLISHSVRPDPVNRYGWIVDFVYPDCIRSFDGKNWSVKPR